MVFSLVNLPQTSKGGDKKNSRKSKGGDRTAGCGIQIKVIHNYKAETIKSSTDEDTINT